MTINIQEAIKRSIQTEKSAMYFYKMGAERMQEQAARDLFELLAREEREHGIFIVFTRALIFLRWMLFWIRLRIMHPVGTPPFPG